MFKVADVGAGGSKLTGRSKALVLDNVDPNKQGRIKIDHLVFGTGGMWVPYLTVPGMFTPPRIGDVVYVEADCGHHNYPVAWGNLTKEGGGAIPDTFLRSEPTNIGMYSVNNHLFELDDGKGLTKKDAGVRITTSGLSKFHLIDDITKPGILLQDKPGNTLQLDTLTNKWTWKVVLGTSVVMDGVKDSILLKTKFGDSCELSASNGIQMSVPTGATLSMKNAKFDITAKTTFTVEAITKASITGKTGVDVKTAGAGAIEITPKGVAIKGTTGELLTLIEELLDALSQATYPGFGAPASNVVQYPLIKAKITGMKA